LRRLDKEKDLWALTEFRLGDLVCIREWDWESKPCLAVGIHHEIDDGEPPGPKEIIYIEVFMPSGEIEFYDKDLLQHI